MFEKLKKYNLFIKKYYILILFLIGILIIFLSSNIKEKPTTQETFNDVKYINSLEEKITKVVSVIEGAGECLVVINHNSSTESVYVKDYKKTYDNDSDKSKTKSEDTIITMKDKNGNEYALVTKQLMPTVSGVTIVCDGGNDIKVKNSIISAVSTLLGIGTNNVCVIAKAN